MSLEYSMKLSDTTISPVQLEDNLTASDFIKWLVDSSRYWKRIGSRPNVDLIFGESTKLVYKNYANILIGERISKHLLKQLWDKWCIMTKYNRSFNKTYIEEASYEKYKLKLLYGGDYITYNEELLVTEISMRYHVMGQFNGKKKQRFYLLEYMNLDTTKSGGICLGESKGIYVFNIQDMDIIPSEIDDELDPTDLT